MFWTCRSFESDQYQLFHQVEKSLAQMGVNGKGCLLRTICEMQKRPIDHYSIMGEIVTVLMT
jgi:DM4/DM12 family